jgi:hypothetical protein
MVAKNTAIHPSPKGKGLLADEDKIEKQDIDRSDIARMKGKKKRDIETAMRLAREDIFEEVEKIIDEFDDYPEEFGSYIRIKLKELKDLEKNR